MPKKIIIIGTGGHAKVIADIVLLEGNSIFGFLDDFSTASHFLGFPVIGATIEYIRYLNAEFVVAIGDAVIREKIVNTMPEAVWHTAIHPSAIVSPLDVQIGRGTVIMAGAVINPGACIGEHCIINTSAVVEHDSILENFVHVSVCASLAGTVHVGARSFIGTGAHVSNNVDICSDCVLGAGTVIIENIKKSGTYVGIPGRNIH